MIAGAVWWLQDDPAPRPGEDWLGYAMRLAETPVKKIQAFWRGDAYGIASITAKEVGKTVQRAGTGGKALLIYVYSLDCFTCDINLDDVNDIARTYDKKKLAVLAVAVGDDRAPVGRRLLRLKGGPAFRPFIMEKGEALILLTEMRLAGGAGYKEPPFLGIVSASGDFHEIAAGPGKGASLRQQLRYDMK